MDPATRDKVAQVLEGKDGINKKLQAILTTLTLANLAYGIVLKPSALLVHPQNRGSQMTNAFDVHRKGSAIVKAGLQMDMLHPSSICIELSSIPAMKDKQIGANVKMAEAASGMLPLPSGQERYLTLGNSHFVMFLKAMEAGSLDPNGGQVHMVPEFEKLIGEGWKWMVISEKVEESFPNFPSFCQAALNSVNSNQTSTSELEAMLQLATYVNNGLSIQAAVENVKAAQPVCANYLADIGHFVKLYTGGTSFPLLGQLRDFCSLDTIWVSMLQANLNSLANGLSDHFVWHVYVCNTHRKKG